MIFIFYFYKYDLLEAIVVKIAAWQENNFLWGLNIGRNNWKSCKWWEI